MQAVDISPCDEASTAGLGVYASETIKDRFRRSWRTWVASWFWSSPDVVLARFPLEFTVTARTITADKKLGSAYKQLLDTGRVTERELIMLFLITERIRGAGSAWYPWVSMLPQAFSTPLFFGKAELDELRGTTLHRATEVLKRQLHDRWAELAHMSEGLLRSTGSATQGISATFDDFLWAHSVFWSRSITFPEPNADSGDGSSAVISREGIVPGLDFCNHDANAQARWSIWNKANTKGKNPEAVALVASKKAQFEPGQEVTISYGDKSNEELLLQYGFVEDRNAHEALMVVCPLPPPAEWDGVIEARMHLLAARGLSPQLFLTEDELKAGAADRRARSSLDMLGVSQKTWNTLEALVMEPAQLAAALSSLSEPAEGQAHQLPAAASGTKFAPSTESAPSNAGEASGMRLAQLTTLRRLLELKVVEMEGEDGTGSLEDDIRLLEATKADTVSPTLRSCLVYRASQKRLARGFLAQAEAAQAHELQHLQATTAKV